MEVKKSTEILKFEKMSDAIVREAQTLTLQIRSDLEISGEIMARIKIEKAKVKAKKDEGLIPAKRTVAVIEGWFKPIEKALIAADKIVREKDSDLQIKLDNERRERERKAEIERQEKERKEKEKLLKRAKLAEEKGQAEKAESLREQEAEYFQPMETVDSVDNTIELESGKTHGVDDVKIVSLDPIRIIQGLAKGVIPIGHVGIVKDEDGNPQSLKITGLKRLMKDKFKCTDQDYYGIRVKKIIRSAVSAGV